MAKSNDTPSSRAHSQEAAAHDCPLLAKRGRRKSKDLEEQVMKVLAPSLEAVFKLLDVSGDGQLDNKELTRVRRAAARSLTRSRSRPPFPWTGATSLHSHRPSRAQAFELAGRPTSDEAIARAIQQLDKDNDGLVNFEEFKAIAYQTAVTTEVSTGAGAA